MHFNEYTVCILTWISLKFVPKCPIDHMSALLQVMTWRQTADKPLPKAILTQFTDTWHELRNEIKSDIFSKSLSCWHIWFIGLGNVTITLTHWGRVTHICVSKLTIIGSDNGLSPGQRQAIIWNNAGLLLIEPIGTNFSEISIGIQRFSFKEMHLNMSSAKWRPFCLGLNELKYLNTAQCHYNMVNFLRNPHDRHPTAFPFVRDMGCLLWLNWFTFCHCYHSVICNNINKLDDVTMAFNSFLQWATTKPKWGQWSASARYGISFES